MKARINAQAVSLLNADIQSVPIILEDLAKDLDAVIPQLKQLQAKGELTDDQRLRIRLALVQSDESIAAELVDQLLTTHLLNVPVITTALQPHRDRINETLWQVFHDKSQPDERRFRAGLALAVSRCGLVPVVRRGQRVHRASTRGGQSRAPTIAQKHAAQTQYPHRLIS